MSTKCVCACVVCICRRRRQRPTEKSAGTVFWLATQTNCEAMFGKGVAIYSATRCVLGPWEPRASERSHTPQHLYRTASSPVVIFFSRVCIFRDRLPALTFFSFLFIISLAAETNLNCCFCFLPLHNQESSKTMDFFFHRFASNLSF